MGHFRRMDPQPHPLAYLTPRMRDGEVHYLTPPPSMELVVPADMPGARPWQDRDREWYWRKDLPG